MEALLAVIVLGAVLVPLFLILAWARLGELSRELNELRRRVRTLEGGSTVEAEAAKQRAAGRMRTAQRPTDGPAIRPGAEPDDLPRERSDGGDDRRAEPAAAPEHPSKAAVEAVPGPAPRPTRQAPEQEPDAAPAPAPLGAAAAVAAPGPSPRSADTDHEQASFDWERWLGVRGAAVVGGIALILAGLFFVQVAIERGWLGPAARDALAFTLGAIGLAAHRPLRRRGYIALGESIGGAGTVLMYGAAWAAAQLHGLMPSTVALTLMASTTITALILAARSNAQILATFAIVGGFATPIVLGTVGGSAASVFGYVLVLDLCLLALTRTRHWRVALPGAVIGTAVVQYAWSDANGWVAAPWVVVTVLGVFALLFAIGQLRPFQRDDAEPSTIQGVSTLAALGLPVLFALRAGFGAGFRVDDVGPLWPVAALSAVLCLAATAFMILGAADDRSRRGALPLAAVGSVTMLAWWTLQRHAGGAVIAEQAWVHWAWSSFGLGALLLLVTWSRRAWLAPLGFAVLSIALSYVLAPTPLASSVVPSFPIAVAVLTLLALVSSLRAPRPNVTGSLVGLVAGFALTFRLGFEFAYKLQLDAPLSWAPAGLSVALTLAAVLFRRVRSDGASQAWGAAALTAPLPVLLAMIDGGTSDATLAIAGSAVLAISIGIGLRVAAAGAAATVGALCSVGALLATHAWTRAIRYEISSWDALDLATVIPAGFVLGAALPIALAIAGRRTGSAVRHTYLTWIGGLTAASLPLQPAALVEHITTGNWYYQFVPPARVLLLIGAAVMILAAAIARRGIRDDRDADGVSPSGISAAISLTIAAGLGSVVLAQTFAVQWTTVAAALTAGAWALLTGRAGSAPQRNFATGIVTIATVALLLVTFVARSFAVDDFFLPLQLTIDFGLVLAGVALAAAAYRAADPSPGRAFGRVTLTASALAIGFGWMNAAVINRFSTGGTIGVELERMQARDLSLSIAWALFGALLLTAGMVRRVPGLRWTSLAVFIVTIFKVFLYDLGALSGMSRVGSFLGLAVALLGVSLVYARVLGREDERGTGGGDTLRGDDARLPAARESI